MAKLQKKCGQVKKLIIPHSSYSDVPPYAHIPSDERSKLDSKSLKCIFLGFKKGVKGYKLWDPVNMNKIISRDVVFDEAFMMNREQDGEVKGHK